MISIQHLRFRVQAGGVAVFMKNILAILLLFVPVGVAGHEIPADVTVRVFIRPAGNRLELLVRVPLEAMPDMQVPTREQGYLDLSRVEDVLRDAAILWISDYVEIYEGKSQASFTLVPQLPDSWPTTWLEALTTGAPLLPPSVAPNTSRL